jgi:hypothetical protein
VKAESTHHDVPISIKTLTVITESFLVGVGSALHSEWRCLLHILFFPFLFSFFILNKKARAKNRILLPSLHQLSFKNLKLFRQSLKAFQDFVSGFHLQEHISCKSYNCIMIFFCGSSACIFNEKNIISQICTVDSCC